MRLGVCGHSLPSSRAAGLPEPAAVHAIQPVRTHRRRAFHAEGPSQARGGWGRPVATRVAIDDFATDLEEVASQGEISYHPDVGLMPPGSSGVQIQDHASILPRLLATWDKAVQRRNQELLTPIQGKATKSKHKKRGQGSTARQQKVPEQAGIVPSAEGTTDILQALAAKDLSLYKNSNLMQLELPELAPDMPSVHPQSLGARQPVLGVGDVMQWFANDPPAFMQGYTLAKIAEEAPQPVLHASLKLLGSTNRPADVEKLLLCILAAGRENTHTWSTAFIALADAGHLNVALRHFEKACREGRDIGPAGASSLVWLAARSRNVDLALDLYYKMSSVRTTLNRYMFNCLLHLCAVMGRVNDALDIITHMRAEAAKDVDCKPDGFTYSALLRAISSARRWELLNKVFFTLLRDQVTASDQVWSQLLTGAGKAGRHDWARDYFTGYRSQLKDKPPSLSVINAYLLALCRSNHLEHMMSVYQQMPAWGLQPDSYTYVALLTGMARDGAGLEAVQGVLRQMRLSRLMTTSQLASALLNAYRRTPELARQEPSAVQVVLESSAELMRDLVGRRLANSRTYTLFAMLHILAGRAHMVQPILQEAIALGCALDHVCYHNLHLVCLEAGLQHQADQFMLQRNTLRNRAKAARRAAAEREARFKAWATA